MYTKIIERLHNAKVITKLGRLNSQFLVRVQAGVSECIILHDDVIVCTDFLGEVEFNERIHCILHNITTKPVCEKCDTKITLRYNKNTKKRGYAPLCFKHHDKASSLAKRSKTNMELYGVINASSSDIIKTRRKDNNFAKYGVEFTAQTDSVKQKIKQTNLDKYGVEFTAQVDSVKQKIKQTNLDKYGITCPLHSPEIRLRVKQTNIERYGVEYATQNEQIQEKAKKTNRVKYGADYHMSKHISKHVSNLDDPNWLIDEHHNKKKSISQISHDIGVGVAIISRALHDNDIDIVRYPSSVGEKELGEFITSLGIEIQCGLRSIIPPLELDIFIPSHNIAFEFNGIYWHGELNNKHKKYHTHKTEQCNNRNIRLIHVYENEWYLSQSIVKSRIKSILHKSEDKIYGRSCIGTKISTSDKNSFLATNHIQGTCTSSINYGLIHNNELVAVMTFGKPRFSKKYDYELIRFANKINCNVVGGASKMFSLFTHQYAPKSIVSYSDNRWNTGDLYNHLGFQYSHTSPPNYKYFHRKDGSNTLLSRHKFQKHKLSNLLEHFNPSDTEWENMVNNGYDRIWDCGNAVFHWHKYSK